MLSESIRRLVAQAAFAALLLLTWWLGHRDETPGAPSGEGGPGFHLTEVSRAAGLDFRHEAFVPDERLAHIEPQIAATGAGASIVDADGDGWIDLYLTSSAGANALFLNRHDGTFEDVAARVGLADLNAPGNSASMGSVWADMDADGDEDVFVYAYGRSRLLRQDDGADGMVFTDVTAAAGLDRWMNANAAIWFDYDRDGWLDLYVGGYFRDETNLWELDGTDIMHDSFEFSGNGGHNFLYRNLGDGTFEDVTEATGTDSTRWTYAAAAADFDDDGWVDLYIANDYGSEELLLNKPAAEATGGEGRVFERVLGAGLEADSKSGMSVSLGNVENDGRLAVYVTNISEQGFLFQGNNLRLNYLGDMGQMMEIAQGHSADCGWAWGAQFTDLDADGWQDLFVANGFVSDDPDRSYWYDMTKVSGSLNEVFMDAGNWPAMEGRSLSGYERSRVLINHEGRYFRDVAEEVGVNDRLDGRAVAVGDFWNDGAPDVVVANQRGPVLLYSNEAVAGRHRATLELVGAGANHEAIGATVLVTFGEAVQRHVVTAGQGFCAQNDRRIHLGLGAATRLDRVEIHWPSGAQQVLTDLAADEVHVITEDES